MVTLKYQVTGEVLKAKGFYLDNTQVFLNSGEICLEEESDWERTKTIC